MQEQKSGAPPDVDQGRPLDRRAGPRRVTAEGPVNLDRRQQGDRRRRKPGLAALFGAVLVGLEKPKPKPKRKAKGRSAKG